MGDIKGRFIMSYNDCPLVWELYKGFNIERVTRKTTLAGNGDNNQPFAEVIIRNF